MKIGVPLDGHVDLSNAILLAAEHSAIALDIVESRILELNREYSLIADMGVENYPATKTLGFKATLDKTKTHEGSYYGTPGMPTDYYSRINYFNSASIYFKSKAISES